jgi:hypothetical protein
MKCKNIYDKEFKDLSIEASVDMLKICSKKRLHGPKMFVFGDLEKECYDLSLLFEANFMQYKMFCESNGIYKDESNNNYNYINKSTLESIAKALNSLRCALASVNIPLSMRIIREIYDTLIVSIAINQGELENKKGYLYSNYDSELAKYNSDDVSDSYYIDRLIKKIDGRKIFDDVCDFSLFDLDLSFTYPLFRQLDKDKECVNIKKPNKNKKQKIKTVDLAKILNLHDMDYIYEMTQSFYSYSLLNQFFDSEYYAVSPLDFPDDNRKALCIYINLNKVYLLQALKQLSKLLDAYFGSCFTNGLERYKAVNKQIIKECCNLSVDYFEKIEDFSFSNQMSFEDSDEAKFVSILKDFKQQKMNGEQYHIENDKFYPSLTRCNVDPTFIDIMRGKISIDTDRDKDSINKFFNDYKQCHLVTDECYHINHEMDVDTMFGTVYDDKLPGFYNIKRSGDLAYKWMNIFRSFLNGIRFSDTQVFPIEAYVKSDINSDMRKIFILNNAQNVYKKNVENNIDQLMISCVQMFCNMCNSIILNDESTALNEARRLYDAIVIKTYLSATFFEDYYSDKDGNQSRLISYLNDSVLADEIGLIRTKNKKIVEESHLFADKRYNEKLEKRYIDRCTTDIERKKIDTFKPFSFTLSDNLKSVNDIADFLYNEKGIDVYLVTFNKMLDSYAAFTAPFLNKGGSNDDALVLMILDYASLLVRTTGIDLIITATDSSRINRAVSVLNYMLKKDLKLLDTK